MLMMRRGAMALGALLTSLAAACTSEAPGDVGPEGAIPGAADGFGGDGAALVSCNDGALVIERSADRPTEMIATIADHGVVDWFVAQSELTSEEEVEYSGSRSTVTVEHALPWMVSVEERTEGSALIIRDLRPSPGGDGYALSGPGGVTIRPEGEGLRLTISGSTMPSSHTVVHYEVGQWLFEACGGASPGDEPTEGPVEDPTLLGEVYFDDDTLNTEPSYDVDVHGDVAACELYIDSFAEFSVYQYHHAGYSGLLIDAAVRSDFDVLDVGMYLRVDEQVTRSGDVLVDEADREIVFGFTRRHGELYRGIVHLSVDRTDGSEARREVERFALFVDVRDADGTIRRLWLKAEPARDFEPADYARESYCYSEREPFYDFGAGSISYLWRDSGSPIFAAREACL